MQGTTISYEWTGCMTYCQTAFSWLQICTAYCHGLKHTFGVSGQLLVGYIAYWWSVWPTTSGLHFLLVGCISFRWATWLTGMLCGILAMWIIYFLGWVAYWWSKCSILPPGRLFGLLAKYMFVAFRHDVWSTELMYDPLGAVWLKKRFYSQLWGLLEGCDAY